MDIYDKHLECITLRTLLTAKQEKVSRYILSKLKIRQRIPTLPNMPTKYKEGHFGTAEANDVLELILKYTNKLNSAIPTDTIIMEDLALKNEAKLFLQLTDKTYTSKREIDIALLKLENYRKVRTLHSVMEEATLKIRNERDPLYITAIIEQMNSTLSRTQEVENLNIVHTHDKKTADGLVQAIINPVYDTKILTGLTEFDARSGGFNLTDLVLIAGPTGGGKSIMALQIATTMAYNYGKKVCYISLEMDQKLIYERILANYANIDHDMIHKNILNDRQKIKIQKVSNALQQQLVNNKGVFDIWCPTGEYTPERLIDYFRVQHFDVIFIDYIGLLPLTQNKENNAFALSEAVRAFKVAANELNSVIVVVAQYDQEQKKLKFSKAMKDHANIMWQWELDEDPDKRPEEVPILQIKARSSQTYTFKLRPSFRYMRWENSWEFNLQAYQQELEQRMLEQSAAQYITDTNGNIILLEEDDDATIDVGINRFKINGVQVETVDNADDTTITLLENMDPMSEDYDPVTGELVVKIQPEVKLLSSPPVTPSVTPQAPPPPPVQTAPNKTYNSKSGKTKTKEEKKPPVKMKMVQLSGLR